jgi:hypothetical protein
MRDFSGAAPVYAICVPPGFRIEQPTEAIAAAVKAADYVPVILKCRVYQWRVPRVEPEHDAG